MGPQRAGEGIETKCVPFFQNDSGTQFFASSARGIYGGSVGI